MVWGCGFFLQATQIQFYDVSSGVGSLSVSAHSSITALCVTGPTRSWHRIGSHLHRITFTFLLFRLLFADISMCISCLQLSPNYVEKWKNTDKWKNSPTVSIVSPVFFKCRVWSSGVWEVIWKWSKCVLIGISKQLDCWVTSLGEFFCWKMGVVLRRW